MIRRITFLGLAGLLLSLSGSVCAGRHRAQNTPSTSVPIMQLEQVKAGMTGTIKTVFQGDRIDTFGFKVLGIMRNAFGPKQDIILVRLMGAKPEFTGVVAGMSGSPAYIDGKLIGALSLRFGFFTKEPIAGITPIESMLRLFDIKEASPHRRRASGPGVHLNSSEELMGDAVSVRGAVKSAGFPRLLEPIPTPLFFPGFRQDVIERFAPLLEQHHLVPLAAGSVSRDSVQFNPDESADFVPGAPIAVALVAGDLNIYAVGTVSYRDENRVLAFGHPFFQIGGTDMPMAKASILTTLASQQASFKIAEMGDIVGSVRQDRLTAIMGLIGARPDTIPINVKVHSPVRGLVPYHYDIIQHPTLTPLLFGISLVASITSSLEESNEMTLEVQGIMHIQGHPDLRFEDAFASSDASFFQPVPVLAANQVNRLFTRLFNNGFETARITGVEVDFKLSEARRLTTIEELRVDKQDVRPGDEVHVYALLQPYRGEAVVRRFKLKIPENLKPGDQLRLLVSDGSTIRAREWWRNRVQVSSLDSLIALLNGAPTNNRLYLRLSKQAAGYFMKDRLLPSLPPSVMSVIESGRVANEAARVEESSLALESVGVGSVVRGRRELTLTVK